MSVDSTERKRVEEALRMLVVRNEAILAAVPDIIMEVDGCKRYTWANQAGLRFFGEDVVGREASSYFDREQETYNTVQPLLDGCEDVIYEESRQRRQDGEKRLLSWWCKVLKDEEGRVTGALSTARDITDQRQAEETLRESENRFRLVMETIDEVFWMSDVETGRIFYISPSFERIWGRSRESLSENPQSFLDAIHVEDKEHVLAGIELKKTGLPFEDEYRIILPDGNIRNIWDRGFPIRNEMGKISSYAGVAMDITTRKQAAVYGEISREVLQILNEPGDLQDSIQRVLAALKTRTGFDAVGIRLQDGDDFPYFAQKGFSKDFLLMESSLIERTTDGGVCRDKDGNVSLECTCGLVITGKTDPANPLFTPGGSCWTNDSFPLLAIPPDEDPRLRPRNQCIHQGYASVALVPIWNKDRIVGLIQLNDRRTGRFTLETVELLEGIASHLGAALMRKRAEEALRESEEKYRLLFDSAGDAILIHDEEMRLLSVNQPACEQFGYTHAELMSMKITQLDLPKEAPHIPDRIARLMEHGRITFESVHQRKDGSPIPIEVNARRITWGGQPAIMSICRDLTERAVLQERLQRAEKMEALGQLAGGVAHDLNNVLGILSGYSELLLDEIPEGNQSRDHVMKILQSTEKGAAIIQDLLTLTRRGVTTSEVINLNRIVSGFLKTPVFERMKDYHSRVTFSTDCDKDLLSIKGSPIHLEKTLMNLMSNAAESISGKGKITIRTENRYLDSPIRGYASIKQGDYVVLTVSDTGMGIPAENREKIFEPFYTKKTMGRSGTGLGLAVVWGTVKDHSGYIDVQTEAGEGTTFTLYFPVTREELITPPQKEPIERYMGKGESVLVVDDIAEQRDVASRLLTRLGYEAHAVSSGEEAAEYLKGNEADIVLLDMIMAPGIDGLETYQRIKEINPKQKVILVSGFSETDRVKEAQKLGAGAYVKKPYVMETIGVAIRDELNR